MRWIVRTLSVVAVVAGACYAVAFVRGRPYTRPPAVDCPAVVDIGPREFGTHAAAEFEVRNAGGGVLELADIRTNCACHPVDVKRGNEYFTPGVVRVPAGEAVTLRVVQTVRVPAGLPQGTPVYFRTNAPDAPEVSVLVSIPVVAGGVSADPPRLTVGEVQLGQEVVRTVAVRDAVGTRRVTGVTCSDPGRWAVRLLEPPSDGAVARIEVRLTAAQPGPIDTEVLYTVDDPLVTPEPVRVTGRLSRPVECSPPAVTLPRQSSAGPVYSMNVLCRNTTGTPFTLTPGALPAGWSLSVRDAEPKPVHLVTVTLDPKKTSADRSAVLQLTAAIGDGAVPVELPVSAGD